MTRGKVRTSSTNWDSKSGASIPTPYPQHAKPVWKLLRESSHKDDVKRVAAWGAGGLTCEQLA